MLYLELKNQSDQDSSWIKGKTRFKHVEKEAVEIINLITGSQIADEEKRGGCRYVQSVGKFNK